MWQLNPSNIAYRRARPQAAPPPKAMPRDTVAKGLLEGPFSVVRGWQIAVGIVCAVALIFMAIPVFTIDEKKWSRAAPSTMPLIEAMKAVLGNPFFRFYAAADFAYFGGLAIIQTGVLFYVTVLLELEEWVSTVLLLLMVVVSAFLFPLVARWARRQGGGKRLTIIAFLIAAAVFLAIATLGLLDGLRDEREGFDYTLRELFSVVPSMTPTDSPIAAVVADGIRARLAREPDYVVSPGTYDQKHIDRIGRLSNCIAYGPGILELAHQPDEWVGIDDMVDSACVMGRALLALLGGGRA